MDTLGERIIRDEAEIRAKRDEALRLEARVTQLRREANEIERLLDLARFER